TKQQVKEMALFNVRKLENKYKTDEVKGNIFYFVNSNEGYDARIILINTFLNDIQAQGKGEMLLEVPHQEVYIMAVIRNNTGYDVMTHETMEFFTKGLVPNTTLSLAYDNGHFELIFILGKNNKQKRNPNVIQRLEATRKQYENKDKKEGVKKMNLFYNKEAVGDVASLQIEPATGEFTYETKNDVVAIRQDNKMVCINILNE